MNAEIFNDGLATAKRACGVWVDFHIARGCGQSVIDKQPASHTLTYAKNFFDHFRGLQRAKNTRDGAEDPGFLACGNLPIGGWLWIEAPVARTADLGFVGRELSI
jgi:hypothetical protein